MKKNESLQLKDTPVSSTLAILDEKLQKLKRVQEAVYKCPSNLEGFGDIQNETKPENLIRAFGSIISRENSYHAGAAAMGKTTYQAFKIQGCSPEDWKSDILLKQDVLEFSAQLNKLNALKAKAQEFMTKEEQWTIFQQELQNI